MRTHIEGKITGGKPDCVHQMIEVSQGWDCYIDIDDVPCEEMQLGYVCQLCGAEQMTYDITTPDKTLIQIAEDIEDEL